MILSESLFFWVTLLISSVFQVRGVHVAISSQIEPDFFHFHFYQSANDQEISQVDDIVGDREEVNADDFTVIKLTTASSAKDLKKPTRDRNPKTKFKHHLLHNTDVKSQPNGWLIFFAFRGFSDAPENLVDWLNRCFQFKVRATPHTLERASNSRKITQKEGAPIAFPFSRIKCEKYSNYLSSHKFRRLSKRKRMCL
jgi:hypothetical protein